MGFLDNLVKLATDVLVTPLAVAKDIVTFGEDEETAKKLQDLKNDLQNLIEND